MEKKNIVVIMGGTSTEAAISRQTGTAILKALQSKGYPAVGMELHPETFAEEIKEADPAIVFNALAAVTMDKAASKRVFVAEGISTPRSHTYQAFETKERDLAAEIERDFGLPVVVKAASQGSSIGVYIVEQAADLKKALADAFRYNDEVLVEQFIRGRELTVAVWGDAEKKEAFPIIEITTESGRYDYESKYTKGASHHIIPAPLSDAKAKEIQALAVKTFTACGCRGVARVDMMLSEDETPYVIEVNSVPGMTELSLVPDAGRAMGIEFPELCERILAMAGYRK